jgi:FkbM family methyltransferase
MIESFLSHIPQSFPRDGNYVIFDIGSRDCIQSIEFYNAFPKAKIYSFECNPNTLDICRKNIENYSDRITLVEGAVCDYNGEVTFYPIDKQRTITTWEDGNPGASSLFRSNGSYDSIEKYVQNEITVNCHRLDTVLSKYNIDKIDIIWMDLQGAELLALKGLGDFITKVKYIHTEVCHKAIYENQVLFGDLNNYIVSKGFRRKNNLYFRGWFEDVIYENISNN